VIWLDRAGGRVKAPAMKAILAACFTGFLLVSLQAAAPPATKKGAKAEKVDAATFLKKFDTNSDGKLDKAELAEGLKTLRENSVTTKNDSWKKFDEDADGKISLAELKKLLDSNDKPNPVDPAEFLKKFDLDRDGKLNTTELNMGIKSLKPNSLTAKPDFWKKFDENYDGKINLKELEKLLDEYNRS
jgi:Ca2+-binding EF-hand superfamily protein